VDGKRAGEVAGKSEVNQVPAKAEEKAVGNKSLIRQDIAFSGHEQLTALS